MASNIRFIAENPAVKPAQVRLLPGETGIPGYVFIQDFWGWVRTELSARLFVTEKEAEEHLNIQECLWMTATRNQYVRSIS
jgi:hypothetical protein